MAVEIINSEDIPLEVVSEIRAKLIEEVGKVNDATLFDAKEYQRLLHDDDHLRRYIKRKKGDVSQSVTFLVEVLRWRKKLGVPDMVETTFPKEFYELGGIHVYSEDKDGNILLHVRLRLFQKIPEILELLKKFTVFQMLRADEEAARRGNDVGWVLLFDCSGAGVANADMEMANFVNTTLRGYFPSGQKYVLIHNLPWLLNALKNIVFAMLPSNVKQRIKFSSDKNIKEYIPEANLPEYMGGTCQSVYPVVPQQTFTTAELIKVGTLPMSSDEQTRVKKYYEKLYLDPTRAADKEADKQTVAL